MKQLLKSLLPEAAIREIRSILLDYMISRFFLKIKPMTTNHRLIRIGGDSDGGYLIPNDLNGVKYCFSPGVSIVADFEYEIADNYDISCFLADYSVDAPPVSHHFFDFEKKFIGVSENDKYTTLKNWVERHATDSSDLLLQMDIEGSEFDVILTTEQETL